MGTLNKRIFKRLVEGAEKSEDYARNHLPSNRWALGWDLIKTNMGKIVKINLLLLLFIFPLFLLLYLRSLLLSVEAGYNPFSQNLGIGYPIYPFMSGLSESIIIRVDFTIFLLLFIFVFYMSVGISGAFYVMRNMVWTEGVFVVSDFWIGVKKNYKTVLPLSLIYTAFVILTLISINTANYQIAINPNMSLLFNVIKIVSYVFIALFTCIYLFSLTISVTYKIKLFGIIKNAFIFTIAMLPINVFFMLLSAIPFALLLFDTTTMMFSFGIIAVILLSMGLSILIWTNYCQWVFDECINDKVAGAKKNKGIYKKNSNDVAEQFVYKKSSLTTKPVKPITDYDIEIVELPESFSRKDLIRLEESKKR
ncbi:MAG: DUF624 domain-containing protein, partial [Clostridia bacterium]|nr:DUF624 domain-containing protein [Clostridia bacterium]